MRRLVRFLIDLFHHGLTWLARLAMLAAVVAALLFWGLRNGPVPVPTWGAARLSDQAQTLLEPLGLTLSVGALAVDLRQGVVPAMTASDVALLDRSGDTVLRVGDLDAVLARDALLGGHFRLGALRASGLDITLRRDSDGRLSLDLGEARVVSRAPSGQEVMQTLQRLLAAPELDGLQQVGITDVAFSLEDAARAEPLTSSGGTLRITRNGAGMDLALDAGRIGVTDVGRAALSMSSAGGDAPLSMRVALRGLVPAELSGLAGRSPVSELLARFDAPVSLTMEGGVEPGGALTDMTGTLAVGSGTVDLPGRDAPARLDWLRADLALSPAADHLSIRGLDLSAPSLSLKGAVDLRRAPSPSDGTTVAVSSSRYTAQVALEDLTVAVPEFYSDPQRFDGLWATLAYARGSDTLQIADLSVIRPDVEFHAKGHAAGIAGKDPVLMLDLDAPRLAPQALLALWPADIGKGGRRWIAENLHAAQIRDLNGAVRLSGSGAPQLGLSFAFDEGRLHAAKRLPEITGARGVGQIADKALSLLIDRAEMQAEAGEVIRLSDGAVHIAPIFQKGASLRAGFHAVSDVAAVLSLLSGDAFRSPDAPPSKLLSQMGDADGRVAADLRLDMPLRRGTKMTQVNYGVSGRIDAFSTENLVPSRLLTANGLIVSASPKALHISGQAQLDGHPFSGNFDRPLRRAADPNAPGRVVADGALTPALAQTFGLNLPPGAATGAGRVTARIDLPRGEAPVLALDGDLTGLRLRIPGLGVNKPVGRAGELRLAGQLGAGGRFDVIRVSFPGLRLDASAPLVFGQGIGPMTMRRLVLGKWLDTKGVLTARKGQGMYVSLTGGRFDLRQKPKASGGGGSLRGMDLALDQVQVNDKLTIRNVRGTLNGRSHGNLTGLLNGKVPVTLRLAAAKNGTAIDVTASDAGAVLAEAGPFQGLRGGDFFLRLIPSGPAQTYRGQMRIRDTALKEAGTAARIVSALSVVGAFEQMSGNGIGFGDVRADFTMAPGSIRLHSGSAVGPSLGLSFDGAVDLTRKRLNLQGVVSPLYFLNRAGAFMTRRGEGILGLSYTIKGSFDNPKVAANPLSVLAPGFLREIFRSRPESSRPAEQE